MTERSENTVLLELEAALGHVFRDRGLLVEALTHRSRANEGGKKGAPDNERLEFLGDALLGLVAAEWLAELYPNADEGELTKRRAATVNGQVLAELARELGIGHALRLGKGEERTGGRDKARLLASAFEACLAAIYRDAGFEVARACLRRVLAERIGRATAGHEDYKTRLQEHVQDALRTRPQYDVVAIDGPEHAREFVVSLLLEGEELSRARGRSKVEAEQEAARLALAARLGHE